MLIFYDQLHVKISEKALRPLCAINSNPNMLKWKYNILYWLRWINERNNKTSWKIICCFIYAAPAWSWDQMQSIVTIDDRRNILVCGVIAICLSDDLDLHLKCPGKWSVEESGNPVTHLRNWHIIYELKVRPVSSLDARRRCKSTWKKRGGNGGRDPERDGLLSDEEPGAEGLSLQGVSCPVQVVTL